MVASPPIAMTSIDTSYSAHRPPTHQPPAYDPMLPKPAAHNNSTSNSNNPFNSGDLGTQRTPNSHSRASSPANSNRSSRSNHSRSRVSFAEPAHQIQGQNPNNNKMRYLPGFAGGSGSGSETKHGNSTHISSLPSHDLPARPLEDDGKNGPNRDLYISRLYFRGVSLVLSIALIGLLAHVLVVYQESRDRKAVNEGTGLEFRLWPENLNVKPATIMLAAGASVAGFSVGYLGCAFSAKMRRLTTLGNYTTLIISIICTLLFGIATAYFELWDSDKHNWYDIWSWSCVKGKQSNGLYQKELDFKGVCREMRSVWYLAVGICGVEVGGVLTCVWACVVSGRKYKAVGQGGEEERRRREDRDGWFGM